MVRIPAAFLFVTCLAGAAARDTVVFDTDSGLFGDDGAALVMLVRSPGQVAIQGITIVPGNVWAPQGAEYMLHILELLKKTVAVYTGAEAPLLHSPEMAKEASKRWGELAYMGAFTVNPATIAPAP